MVDYKSEQGDNEVVDGKTIRQSNAVPLTLIHYKS